MHQQWLKTIPFTDKKNIALITVPTISSSIDKETDKPTMILTSVPSTVKETNPSTTVPKTIPSIIKEANGQNYRSNNYSIY